MFRMKYKKLIFSAILLVLSFGIWVVVSAQSEGSPDEPIKTLQFQSADIRSVLRFLADYGKVNVVVAPEVQGTVTVKLSDVPWRTAMDIIGRTYGLAVVDEADGYIRVLSAENYRKEQSDLETHKKSQRELVELETRIVQISNSVSEEISKTTKSLLTERGEAISDKRSNSLIIREVPANMEKVISYVRELDKPSKQIKISTQLLEVFTNDLSELGIGWGATGTFTSDGGNASYTNTAEVLARPKGEIAGRYTINALLPSFSVDAIIEAIVSNGKGKIIAHPEITTVENKQAKIQLGQKVPVKQFDESGNVVIKFEEVGTILNVTPHITAENQILMWLKPERSTYQFDPNGVIINTSNAETNVIVENGQTAVIGGLTTQDEVSSDVGVPILKDIPIVGMLFKFKQTKTESRDLVIFVTPTIVEPDLAMEGGE